MKLVYEILFEVEIEHGYYENNLSPDFSISPTPECAQMLSNFKLIFRETKFGFKVFAPVEPETNPIKLIYPFDEKSLKFSFHMQLHNFYFDAITKLPAFIPSKQLFYFSNIREDIDNQNLYLSDHVNGQRIGNPLKNINSYQLNYKLQAPQNSASFQLKDMFDNKFELPVSGFDFSEPGDKTNLFQINLSEVKILQAGRFIISDNHGGSLPLYFNPQLYGQNVFGIIEIFNNTTNLVEPPANQIPETYRFTENGTITKKGKYKIGFSPSQVKWMYVCRKNQVNSENGISVDKLTVAGPVTFSKVGGDDLEERKILSQDKINSNQTRPIVSLNFDGQKIRDLPTPEMGSVLKKENNEVFFEMYIYV